MSKKELDKALGAPDKLKELVAEGLALNRMDFLYDQLRLVGAVMGLRALVETVTFSDNDSARVAAARLLMDLKEDPADLVERLKAAPFSDLTMDQLEHVVDRLTGGETDLSSLIEEARQLIPTQGSSNVNGDEST